MFLFSIYQFLFPKFFALSNFRRADIRAMPVAVVRFERTLEWLDKFRENSSIWNFTKIRTTILNTDYLDPEVDTYRQIEATRQNFIT